MSNKVWVFPEGVAELLSSSEMENIISNLTNEIANRAGEGFESEVSIVGDKSGRNQITGSRVIGKVYAATPKAKATNSKHNTLLKALKG